jgi:CRP-like cAMP-binding protein
MPSTGLRFDVPAFLESGAKYRTITYNRDAILFAQGDPGEHVLYIQRGRVELSVSSHTGRVAVVAILGPGDFLGEGALTGQSLRRGSARAMTPCTILSVATTHMWTLLETHQNLSARFMAHLLARQSRTEADLVDQIIHSADRRLARVLWLLAQSESSRTLPPITQQTLADMVGTTRSRTNSLLKQLKERGLIDTVDERIIVNDALRQFVSHGTSQPAPWPYRDTHSASETPWR